MSLIRSMLRWVPDELYLKMQFRKMMHRRLDLDNPRTLNEKLQWLKLHDRKDIYTSIVDKASAKDYAAAIIGQEHIVPTLGIWDSFDEIDFDSLPDKFVLKATNGSGNRSVVICTDKATFDRKKARRKLRHGLRKNAYTEYREWPYKNIRPRILAEVFLEEDGGTQPPADYKFLCFDGVPHDVMVCKDRSTAVRFHYFDRDWNYYRYDKHSINLPEGFTLPKPEGIDKAWELAEKLSKGFSCVRVDLYIIKGHVYFSELTFYPGSGYDKIILESTDRMYGDLLKLPKD